jgi:hypothetical protein
LAAVFACAAAHVTRCVGQTNAPGPCRAGTLHGIECVSSRLEGARSNLKTLRERLAHLDSFLRAASLPQPAAGAAAGSSSAAGPGPSSSAAAASAAGPASLLPSAGGGAVLPVPTPSGVAAAMSASASASAVARVGSAPVGGLSTALTGGSTGRGGPAGTGPYSGTSYGGSLAGTAVSALGCSPSRCVAGVELTLSNGKSRLVAIAAQRSSPSASLTASFTGLHLHLFSHFIPFTFSPPSQCSSPSAPRVPPTTPSTATPTSPRKTCPPSSRCCGPGVS